MSLLATFPAAVTAESEPLVPRPADVAVSVVLPTFNEAENVQAVVFAVQRALRGVPSHEILVVDDDSPDGTWRIARDLGQVDDRIRCVRRLHERGLASAIFDGLRRAKGDVLVVIDADFQHDPEVIPNLVAALKRADLAVASRYTAGGAMASWSSTRRFMSRLATSLGRWALGLPVADPMSGFFAIRRPTFRGVEDRLRPRGFKALLEILSKARNASVTEVPYTFGPRRAGTSKLGAGVMLDYLLSLIELRSRSWLSLGLMGPGVDRSGFGTALALRRPKLIALAVCLLVASTLLLTTRFGVWLMLDAFESVDEQPLQLDAAAGPLSSLPFEGQIASIPMPPGIEQPSGIALDGRTGAWLVTTDQAELFVLDPSMSRVLSRTLLLKTLPVFRQGRVEAVAFVPGARRLDDRLAFTGETGDIGIWRRASGENSFEWTRDTSIPLDGELADLEASALAFDPSAGELFIAASGSPVLYVVKLEGTLLRRLSLDSTEHWPPRAVKPGRRADELRISGLSLVEGSLWAVSENFTTLLRIDPGSGRVTDLWSLPDLGEASDLAIAEGSAVFTIDHEWSDPRPSFRRLELPSGPRKNRF
ncbi:MAG: polyprenol monophosphomannose synthase [Acidobacteriota bacterium]